MSFVAALRRTTVEYFRKTSLNGFGLLYFLRRRKIQRLFWFSFIAFGILFASYAVFAMILAFLNYSTVIDLSQVEVLEEQLPLPELRICSGYRFSRRSMHRYAEELGHLSNKSQDYWLEKLPYLSGFYDSLAVKSEDIEELKGPLASTNITALLKKLSPSCRSLILRCEMNHLSTSCSELFGLELTTEGNCCVLKKENLTGELSLFLDSSREDAFPLKGETALGFTFHTPNWLGRASVGPGEVAVLELEVTQLQGNSQLKDYSTRKRGCYFPQESSPRDRCLDECRIKAHLINCQCVPYPFELKNPHQKHCTLGEISCLQLVEENWSPSQCPECLPYCNQMFYRLHKSVLGNLHPWRTKVSIYFRKPHRRVYETIQLYRWYHILSNIGGVLGICIGCSFISGFELIYFVVFRLWSNYLRQAES
ncbi:pickpocket protein 11 [Drosophila bipectinata]|uniref:pickpocket protein 11 n=1 Tax=Drosophila bipectinata TaxID=42026 RepID=UPI001C8AECF2|nr:pickpocket protein 11 [Drosophila bipectinata]